jgi:hypothetical protein
MALPILFFHRGDSWYLWYTLRQARLANPGAPIYLLTDRRTAQYEPFVTQVPIAEYFAGAEAFASRYRHLNTNPAAYELACFQRWFVFREFLARNRLGPAVALDSDVMVYGALAADLPRFAGHDVTVVAGKNPACMFLAEGAEGLGRFTSFVSATYEGRAHELEAWYRDYRASGREGGVCDMTLLDRYRQAFPERVGDAGAAVDGSCYDHNLRRSDGFAMRRGYKRLTWIDGRPHGRRLDTGELVRFSSLHFQGGAKLLIPYFAGRRDGPFFRRLLLEGSPRRTARGLLLLAGR